jgi:hypothetical protein
MTPSAELHSQREVSLIKTTRFGIFIVDKRDGNCLVANDINVANAAHARFNQQSSLPANSTYDLDQLSPISCSMYKDGDELGRSDEGRSTKLSPNAFLSVAEKLTNYGCCILRDVFNGPSLQATKLTCSKLIAKLIKRYDRLTDEFNG